MNKRWIFIVGCYNSGTTLLDRILRQHPAIAGLPREGQFLTEGLLTPKAAGVPRLWAQQEALFRFAPNTKVAEAQQAQQDWLQQLDKPDTLYALEKSPTNTARTLWLQHHFDNAYFIYIVRNGYATAIGIHDKIIQDFGELFPDLLAKAAGQWRRSLEVMETDAPLLKRQLQIRYEALTTTPTQILRQITDFLELDALPDPLLNQPYHIHALQAPISNQNPPRLAAMTPLQAETIERVAGAYLQQYGYTRHA